MMNSTTQATLIKVPAVTLGFWIIKILATTLGETGGDAVSMSMDLGYLISSALFMLLFVAMVLWQIRATDFQPLRYWATILASTTVGTTLADFATRSLGIGYGGGTLLLLTLLALTLVFWHRQLGSIDITSVSSVKAQFFYWLTIMFSQTLGTALGDWTADSADLGYLFAAGVFGSLLLLIVLLTYFSHISRTALFWAAFVLTRPLGAVVGDFLDKPVAQGGLDLSRYSATAALLTTIVLLIVLLPQRAALKTH
ncbi:membrane protein [Shewanella fodinae]|nr:membrane protein [Shewanella fodinae]